MSIIELSPTYTDPDRFVDMLRTQGYAVLSPNALGEFAHCTPAELGAIKPSWDDLPMDRYLKDGGCYRQRRHSSFVVKGAQVTQTAHRAHWQPTEYNALHGGMQRLFEPIAPVTIAQPVWTKLLQSLGGVCSTLKGKQAWYVEAHQFRIDTATGIGRPTPEGAHRDGVDFVAILFVGRANVKGGESRVFEASGPGGQRFTLSQPWTLLMLDDERVIHESTPVQPTVGIGQRDTLVLTYRAGGFQQAVGSPA